MKIVFLGDSITEGCCASIENKRFDCLYKARSATVYSHKKRGD